MFDTPERVRHQFRAGEGGRAELEEVRVGRRGVLSPNTITRLVAHTKNALDLEDAHQE